MHHMIELKIHIVSFVAKTTWKTATCWKTDNRNIKMDLKEVCCENERWIQLAQGRVHWRALVLLAVLNFRVLLPDGTLIYVQI
jgi:hypothetical protein